MSWPSLADLIVAADAQARVGLIGAPLAAGSVTPGRCDLAPAELRKVLRRIATYDVETQRTLSTCIADLGDVPIGGLSIAEAFEPMVNALLQAHRRHELVLLVGGNNAVTRAAVHASGALFETVGLITLDAHLDLRDTREGLSNGNPVRALREDGLPGANIAQIGLAPFANSAAMHRDAATSGHLVIPIGEVRRFGIIEAVARALVHLQHCDEIVVDCDIDVVDRGQLPGAPGARPGGMAAHDFFAAVRLLAADRRVRTIDLTEWDPPLDPSDLSALVAGRWLAECMAGFEMRNTA